MEILQIPVEKIQRQKPEETDDYKEQIERLVSSIGDQGLFHPLTVRPSNNDGLYTLASGNKRLDALIRLGHKTVPCLIRPVTEGEPEEITHIHENLFRFNLPWYEVVEMERKLHELRIKEKGQAKSGPKKTGWSLRDTAKELDMSFGVLSEDIRIAEIVEADPKLKKIGDKNTARRVIFQTLKQMSQEAEATVEIPDFEVNRVYLGSSEQVLKSFPQQIFHACITDPPWMRFIDEKYTSDEFTIEVFKEIYRVLAPASFLFAFVSTDDFFMYRKELPKMGFNVQNMPNIWVKEGYMTRGKRSWEYERDYEPLLVAVKGSPSLTASMLSSIVSCKIVPPSKMIHPNEKPKEVIKKIMNDCTYENALVLDPFAGSGVVCEVAHDLKRRYIGIERSKDHWNKILKRLEKLNEQH